MFELSHPSLRNSKRWYFELKFGMMVKKIARNPTKKTEMDFAE